MGVVVGLFFCVTDASVPVIYGVIIAVGTLFCLYNDGQLDRVLPWRRQRR